MTVAVAEVLRAAMAAAGVSGIYGSPIAGVAVAAPPDVAELLAAADERIHGAVAVAHIGGQVLRAGLGVPGERIVADEAADLPDAVAALVRARRERPERAVELLVDVDLDGSTPPVAVFPDIEPAWVEPADELVEQIRAAGRLGCLVGPGVLRAGCEGGLRSLAAVLSMGVLNTWGAKGVFNFQSRHHLATVGLQAQDFQLGGLGNADLIISSGLDLREALPELWRLAPALDVAPEALGPLSERVWRAHAPIEMPPLRSVLVDVTTVGYAARDPRPWPSVLTRQYAQLVGPRGLVAADPGTAGFFVARTLPTQAAGTACVPADAGVEGFALAACLAARLRRPGRRCVAVVDGAVGPAGGGVLEAAARLGVPVNVEAWVAGGPEGTEDEQLEAVASGLSSATTVVREVGYEPRQLDAFVEVAGPIIAWAGPRTGEDAA